MNNRPDAVVIGSSPLMLLQALKLARSGHSVCVVDRTDEPGGAWQTSPIPGGDRVEIACHVVEAFPRVYDYLAHAAGVRFVALDPQPIRLLASGRQFPYLSRLGLAASGVRMGVTAMTLSARRLLGNADAEEALINHRTKFQSLVRYQLPYIRRPSVMMGPEWGFADFLDRLVAACKDKGVEFVKMHVQELSRDGDEWHVSGEDGPALITEQVHVTTATNLRRVSDGHFEAGSLDSQVRRSVVVDVERASVGIAQTYVALWKDPVVARVSRVDVRDATGKDLRFLVELRDVEVLDRASGFDEIVQRLSAAGIVAKPSSARIAGTVDYSVLRNVDELPSGMIDDSLWAHRSAGNLAAGVAAWLDS